MSGVADATDQAEEMSEHTLELIETKVGNPHPHVTGRSLITGMGGPLLLPPNIALQDSIDIPHSPTRMVAATVTMAVVASGCASRTRALRSSCAHSCT